MEFSPHLVSKERKRLLYSNYKTRRLNLIDSRLSMIELHQQKKLTLFNPSLIALTFEPIMKKKK